MNRSTLSPRYAVGADIGGSHICSAVIDLKEGEIVGEPLTTAVDSLASASEIIDAWARNIRATTTQFGQPVDAVGLAIPGPFDYGRGVSLISGVAKFDSLYALNVARSLRSRLGETTDLRFVNDATAFALGECLGGATRYDSRVVALTLGTGVGSAFIHDNSPVESGDAVPPNGWVYNLPFDGGIVDETFSTRRVCRRYTELTGETLTGVKEIASHYDSDPRVRTLFDEYGRNLGRFIIPIINRFGGNTLLLGGNISRAYSLFAPALSETIVKSDVSIEVKVSTLLDNAALMGAASLFL